MHLLSYFLKIKQIALTDRLTDMGGVVVVNARRGLENLGRAGGGETYKMRQNKCKKVSVLKVFISVDCPV